MIRKTEVKTLTEEEKIEKIRNILKDSPPTKQDVKDISKLALRLSKEHPSSETSLDIILQLLKLFPGEEELCESLRELNHPKRVKAIHYLIRNGFANIIEWIPQIAEEWKYLTENEELLYKFMEMAENEGCKEKLKREIQKNKEKAKYQKINVEWNSVSSENERKNDFGDDIDFRVKL